MLSSAYRITKAINLSQNLLKNTQFFIHHDGSELPRQYRQQYKPHQRQLLYGKNQKKILPTLDKHFFDPLELPGYDQQSISDLYMELIEKKTQISPQFVCILIHMLIKHNQMTNQVFDIIQAQAYRHKGQYKLRSIYGGLRGSILYNREKLYNFFLNQYKSATHKFTFYETYSILEALSNQNNGISLSIKKNIWEDVFKTDFLDGLNNTRSLQTTMITRIIKVLNAFEETDETFWKRLIVLMKGKKGWSRVYILQNLYELSGTYEQAQSLFDKYFQQLSQDQQILNFYNLTQLRFMHPLEIIKHAQQNRQEHYPKIRTLVPQGHDPQQWNQKYQQFLLVGAVKQQAQLIKDKSKSLAFAIRDRYQELKADGQDFSEMSKAQFDQMFGSFDSAQNTIQIQNQKIVAAEIQKQAQKQEEQRKKKQKKQTSKGKKK